MILDINVSKLKNGFDSINRSYSGYADNINNVYSKLERIADCWNDPNVDAFIKKINQDKRRIDDYNIHTKQTVQGVFDFVGSLSSIASSCGFSNADTVRFNSDNASNLSSLCSSVANTLVSTRHIISYYDMPSSCAYRYQIDNMLQECIDISNNISEYGQNFSNVSSQIMGAVDRIKNGAASSNVDPLHIDTLSYSWHTAAAHLENTDDIVKKSQSAQNLTASKVDNEIEEIKTDYQNDSDMKASISKNAEIEEIKTDYQNNSESRQSLNNKSSVNEVNIDYNNLSEKQDGKQVKVTYDDSVEFVNDAEKETANETRISVGESGLNSNINSDTLSGDSDKLTVGQESSNLNVKSESITASNAGIENVLTAPEININTQTFDAGSNELNLGSNNSTVDINSKELSASDIKNDF